jgi:hypothetical protein
MRISKIKLHFFVLILMFASCTLEGRYIATPPGRGTITVEEFLIIQDSKVTGSKDCYYYYERKNDTIIPRLKENSDWAFRKYTYIIKKRNKLIAYYYFDSNLAKQNFIKDNFANRLKLRIFNIFNKDPLRDL